MREYSKPLRRKIGVLTLVLACVFAAGWVRGRYVHDEIVCSRGYFIDISAFAIQLHHHTGPLAQNRRFLWYTRPVYDDSEEPQPEDWGWINEWKWCCAGFEVGQWREDGNTDRHSYFTIQYWLITAPLTILSAWLLLSKPRVNERVPASKSPSSP